MLLEQYILIFLFFLFATIFIYIHVAYPFWSHMPVSHTYDWHHMLSYFNKPRPLESTPYHRGNKFCDVARVSTTSFYDLTLDMTDKFTDLLNCHYLPSDSILFAIEKKSFATLFSGHFDTPYISFYNQLNITNNCENNSDSNAKGHIIGCIASYPLHIYSKQAADLKAANYMGYLSHFPGNNSETRKLIATHEHSCRRKNPEIKASILKKHVGNCAGVRPLVEFETRLLYINPLKNLENKAKTMTSPFQIYRENWSMLLDALQTLPSMFDFCAYIDIGALKMRVDASQMWIYGLRDPSVPRASHSDPSQGHKDEIVALYFIEDALMLYENVNDYGGKTMILSASFYRGQDKSVFARGFTESVRLIQKQNKDYVMMLVDDIGHNGYLTDVLDAKLVKKTSGAYYIINYLLPEKVDKERMFLLM
jgi:hypothetical protein